MKKVLFFITLFNIVVMQASQEDCFDSKQVSRKERLESKQELEKFILQAWAQKSTDGATISFSPEYKGNKNYFKYSFSHEVEVPAQALGQHHTVEINQDLKVEVVVQKVLNQSNRYALHTSWFKDNNQTPKPSGTIEFYAVGKRYFQIDLGQDCYVTIQTSSRK